ncbi:hypothetical protein C8N36_10755 [Pelagimonas varians]|nr:hypothetical protein C8N36_10755 [Pelagimonas varians]
MRGFAITTGAAICQNPLLEAMQMATSRSTQPAKWEVFWRLYPSSGPHITDRAARASLPDRQSGGGFMHAFTGLEH